MWVGVGNAELLSERKQEKSARKRAEIHSSQQREHSWISTMILNLICPEKNSLKREATVRRKVFPTLQPHSQRNLESSEHRISHRPWNASWNNS